MLTTQANSNICTVGEDRVFKCDTCTTISPGSDAGAVVVPAVPVKAGFRARNSK